MKSHNGMRPQDVVVLLKIINKGKDDWQYRDLAGELYLSISEISESLYRSQLAGLVDESRRRVFRQSLMQFIENGLQFVFPQKPGTIVTGIPTAHSYGIFKNKIVSDLNYVWPEENGQMRGLSIIPLYKGVTKAVLIDEELYKSLAAIDIIRVGKTRELKIAIDELKRTILNESPTGYNKN